MLIPKFFFGTSTPMFQMIAVYHRIIVFSDCIMTVFNHTPTCKPHFQKTSNKPCLISDKYHSLVTPPS